MEAIRAHIVELNWHTWDRNADHPQQYPQGDPEMYLIGQPHSPTAAEALEGPIWEAVLPRGAESRLADIGSKTSVVIDSSTWDGSDFFYTEPLEFTAFIVSEAGRRFLEQEANEWLEFRRVITVESFASSSLQFILPTTGPCSPGPEIQLFDGNDEEDLDPAENDAIRAHAMELLRNIKRSLSGEPIQELKLIVPDEDSAPPG